MVVEVIAAFSVMTHFEGFQRGVLDTRMVPVGPLFNRFKRSIRDIARDLGKQAVLPGIERDLAGRGQCGPRSGDQIVAQAARQRDRQAPLPPSAAGIACNVRLR